MIKITTARLRQRLESKKDVETAMNVFNFIETITFYLEKIYLEYWYFK